MVSGFNHISLTVSDIFPGVAYDITEQISEDIFNNNKPLYCTINFTGSVGITDYSKLTCIMTKIDNSIYLASINTPHISGFIVATFILTKTSNDISLAIHYKSI